MMEDVPASAIYRELILEEYKHPQNTGKLENATHTAHIKNPTCGDEITIYLNIENDVVKDIKFQGTGCAISQAAASLFTSHIKGKKIEEINNMDEKEITQLLGFTPNPMRMKCAVLALRAIDAAINTIEGESQC